MDPEDIYIDRRSEYEAMRHALESAGHTVYHTPSGDLPGDAALDAALIECSDDSLTLTVGDWSVPLPNNHTEGAAYYAAGWMHGFDCGAE